MADCFAHSVFPNTRPYAAAGVLPYTFHDGDLLFLLGQECRKDLDGYWSDFGGRRDSSDAFDEYRTAAREFAEETRGIFNDGRVAAEAASADAVRRSAEFMEAELRGGGSHIVRIDSCSYVLFVAPVPYVDERLFVTALQPVTVRLAVDPLSARKQGALWEKQDMAWVPAEKLAWGLRSALVIRHRQRRRIVLHFRLTRVLSACDYFAVFARLRSFYAPPSNAQQVEQQQQQLVPETDSRSHTVSCVAACGETAAAAYAALSESSDAEHRSSPIREASALESLATVYASPKLGSAELLIDPLLQRACDAAFVSFSQYCDAHGCGVADIAVRPRKRRHESSPLSCGPIPPGVASPTTSARNSPYRQRAHPAIRLSERVSNYRHSRSGGESTTESEQTGPTMTTTGAIAKEEEDSESDGSVGARVDRLTGRTLFVEWSAASVERLFRSGGR